MVIILNLFTEFVFMSICFLSDLKSYKHKPRVALEHLLLVSKDVIQIGISNTQNLKKMESVGFARFYSAVCLVGQQVLPESKHRPTRFK